MQKFILYLTFALCLCILPGCSDEPEQARLFSDNNSEVTINADGTTSTGVPYSPFGKQSFFLDHIIYAIDGDHALIIGYSSKLIAEHVRPYAYITYDGVRYPVTEILPEALANSERIKSIELPTTIKIIGDCTFMQDTNLTAIQFPNEIESIGGSVFDSCEHIESIYLPEGIDAISEALFINCSELKYVFIPQTVKSIKEYAFFNCIKLSDITLPSGLQELNQSCFLACNSIKSITIPNGITSIPDNAFTYCGALKEVTLPENLTSIGMTSFFKCSALESIIIPAKVSRIDDHAFDKCIKLKQITSLNPEPPSCNMHANVFSGLYDTAVLYVPAASVNKYKAANCWRDFANIVGI